MSDSENFVDSLLDDIEPPQKRNMIIKNKPLAEAIAYFLGQKAAGDERAKHLSLAWFYVTHLRDRFGGPRTVDTVRTYVRDVLGLDPSTGEPL